METIKKNLNRVLHGTGKKACPNQNKLTIYLFNPPRQGSDKGSKDFKTTYNFKNICSVNEALEIINNNDSFSFDRSDGSKSYMPIKKAFYSNHLLIKDGLLLNKYKNNL